jgi:ATP-dependent protease ClpP protease subunit
MGSVREDLLRFNLQRRRLFMSGEVSSEQCGELVMHLERFQMEDDEAEETLRHFNRDPVVLFIHSQGGECMAGLALVAAIEQSTTPVITVAQGLVGSMALAIYCTGHIRFSYRHATFLYHQISGGEIGMLQDRVESVAFAKRLQERMDASLLARTRITPKKLKEVNERKQDWFFFPEEALDLGVIHKVVDPGFMVSKPPKNGAEILLKKYQPPK